MTFFSSVGKKVTCAWPKDLPDHISFLPLQAPRHFLKTHIIQQLMVLVPVHNKKKLESSMHFLPMPADTDNQ